MTPDDFTITFTGFAPAETLARRFHEAYERLAPSFGYATREDTREFNPESKNGRLMIAVCKELIEKFHMRTD